MAKTKGVQVSGTVREELSAALEDYRWTVRKTRSEIVTTALEEYATNHGLNVPTGTEEATSVEA
jgi:hypothetical protein